MILVSPLSAVDEAIETHAPSHVVSLLDRDSMIGTPAGISPERHLRLGINDVAAAMPDLDLVVPGEAHVAELIAFIDGWVGLRAAGSDKPLLVHCWAGISRSSAAALIALCRCNSEASEQSLARFLRHRGPHVSPNPLIVRHADRLMDRGGRLVAAVAALGPGEMVWEGWLFSVSARPDLSGAKDGG